MGKKQQDYTNVCSSIIYFGWNKAMIFLVSIDLVDFPFSAQNLNSLNIFFFFPSLKHIEFIGCSWRYLNTIQQIHFLLHGLQTSFCAISAHDSC